MKGQCYLKTKPKIANGNKYDAVFAVQYNSGVISAREFRTGSNYFLIRFFRCYKLDLRSSSVYCHCYTNVYGKESVYESNKPSGEGNGCWTYDEESKKCMIDEYSECLELEDWARAKISKNLSLGRTIFQLCKRHKSNFDELHD